MKTATSHIKSNLGKLLVDLTITKLDNWGHKELAAIRHNQPFPLCVPINKDSWAVGSHTIDLVGPHAWRVNNSIKAVHDFYSKPAAIYYAVFTETKHYKTADGLLLADQNLARINDQLAFYTAKLSKSNAKTDSFKLQLWQARYMQAKSQSESAKQELQKKLYFARARVTEQFKINF